APRACPPAAAPRGDAGRVDPWSRPRGSGARLELVNRPPTRWRFCQSGSCSAFAASAVLCVAPPVGADQPVTPLAVVVFLDANDTGVLDPNEAGRVPGVVVEAEG